MASGRPGMNRMLIVIGAIVVIAILAVALPRFGRKPDVTRIGIMQIAEHPALDASRDGFIKRLAELGFEEGENTEFSIQNAQGDMAVAQSIAEKFVSEKVDMILAIATPTAQAAANATKDIPILITAVTDPVAAGLANSIERPGTNCTGTSDLTPVKSQLELLKRICPEVESVGVLYNAGETNSLVQVDIARESAEILGVQLVEVTVSASSGVYEAAQSLVGRVDAIYVPTDNTVVSALESVIKVGEDFKIPVIVGEVDGVRRGALATIGIDYYALGMQTADIAARILKGEAKPNDTPIEYPEDIQIALNMSAAERMGAEIPEDLIDDAYEVIR
ncbi:MAG: ABC transporter substrate-binding protein [Bacillota bacterium]|jgi:putative ABC transport system substrate-binding protein|nr:ABC transporter substrate-binding protein [Bacillota bacterium]HOB89152.1 ABC transporter substrate-binding protein [Bacillota bacterium]HOJ58060.1 ABC transporter substrate-binding protein [Bacillota bacterium]HOL02399.1 ABC transporter substrate-binding protein [Bacillota bacterium]HPO80781.1 ABC transporter substrate-binding protein [Bacillota bacterium]